MRNKGFIFPRSQFLLPEKNKSKEGSKNIFAKLSLFSMFLVFEIRGNFKKKIARLLARLLFHFFYVTYLSY